MPNRLADQSSPYLLQHQNNPVDWYPWGTEAIDRAKSEDRPIFLSIGYSACHWCHVMEHESFENPLIAAMLNEHFVPIKVDREERPDLDQIYMNAVQMMTGHGGWPMSVFLTPDLEPFFGGTYWPPESHMGMPGFAAVLRGVHDAWKNRRDQALEQAASITEHLQTHRFAGATDGLLDDRLLHDAGAALERIFDFSHGGFGGAPKFPRTMDVALLIRIWRRWPRDGVLEMVRTTLDRMAAGGIYDHLGGGFARYSVDARWLVPHFEKMLYDNALLAGCYLDAFVVSGESRYATIVRETLDYVLRDMTDAAGGFYSAEDADSEGVEGKFYVWTPEEIKAVLGVDRAETFCYVYDVSPEGNFEGKSILNLPKTIDQCAAMLGRDIQELRSELAASRRALLAARDRRIRPGRDDKVLVSWNGLMIDSMARAGAVLNEPRYVDAAKHAAEFLWNHLRRDDDRLLHTWRAGLAKLDAYLDDYACLIQSLVTLYEATFDEHYVDEAAALADILLKHFCDSDGGGFFYTADDHERLIVRAKDIIDNAAPSGNAVAATALLRLGKLTGDARYLDAAESTLRAAAGLMKQAPGAAGQMLTALNIHIGPSRQVVLVGTAGADEAIADLRRRFLPNTVVAYRDVRRPTSNRLDRLFDGKSAGKDGEIAAYVCENFTCDEPAVGLASVLAAWETWTP